MTRAAELERWFADVRAQAARNLWLATVAVRHDSRPPARVTPQPAVAVVPSPGVSEPGGSPTALPVGGVVSSGLGPPGLSPCGGALYPPCYVAERESRGQYGAINPGGCGGHACYGKWQFSGAWAGKLGLPVDIARATPDEQNAAARLLWNHGAGCSNWDACS